MAEKTEKRVMVTDFSKGIFGTSDNFNMAWQMAQALATSSIVPNTFQKNPSNCLIALEQAMRLDISPMMVMQNLYIIQGSPTWSSKFLIAAINSSGKYDRELQFDIEKDKDGKPISCIAWTEKDGRRIEGMKIDMNMAQAEGWLSKNGSKWKTMPELMLRYRAASFFSRLNCPEITMGIITREEAEEIGEQESLADVIDSVAVEVEKQTAVEAVELPTEEPKQEKEQEKQKAEPF